MTNHDRQYRRMIASAKWTRLRDSKRADSPMCEMCLERGRYRSMSQVHHIVPVESGRSPQERETLMFDPANLMSLCVECHQEAHRQLKSRSREGRTRRARDEAEYAKAKLFGRTGGVFF